MASLRGNHSRPGPGQSTGVWEEWIMNKATLLLGPKAVITSSHKGTHRYTVHA